MSKFVEHSQQRDYCTTVGVCECLWVQLNIVVPHAELRDNLRSPDRTHSSTVTHARRETPGCFSEPLLCPPVALWARLKRWKGRSARCGPARPPRPPSSLPIPPRTHSASRDAISLCVLTYWASHMTLRSSRVKYFSYKLINVQTHFRKIIDFNKLSRLRSVHYCVECTWINFVEYLKLISWENERKLV